jgi:hypothetical protein
MKNISMTMHLNYAADLRVELDSFTGILPASPAVLAALTSFKARR